MVKEEFQLDKLYRMEKRLKFTKFELPMLHYDIHNKKNEHLGSIEKLRVGAYMHWCYCPIEEIFITAGCMDEIRIFMKNPEKIQGVLGRMELVKEINKLNAGIEKPKSKDIPRCSEHQLYLYFNGETKQDEIIATCKLGCTEFWKKEDWS